MRPAAEFAAGHLRNAKNLPVARVAVKARPLGEQQSRQAEGLPCKYFAHTVLTRAAIRFTLVTLVGDRP